MFAPTCSCMVCQRNLEAIFKAQIMAERQRKQQTICNFLISLARERGSTKVREAFDACSRSIVGDEVLASFTASSQTYSVEPIMPNC